MKKFIAAVPLQVGGMTAARYRAMDNPALQADFDTAFPVMTAINGYVSPGEDFTVVALLPDSQPGRDNFERLREECAALCRRRGLKEPTLLSLSYPDDQSVGAMAELLLRIAELIDDGDQLYSCMTFGTKPISAVLLLALQYGYHVKKNVTIDRVVYGEVYRPGSDRSAWEYRVYDETGLIQLGETARLLAESGAKDPDAVIRRMLGL